MDIALCHAVRCMHLPAIHRSAGTRKDRRHRRPLLHRCHAGTCLSDALCHILQDTPARPSPAHLARLDASHPHRPVGPAGPRNNFNRRTQPAVCPGRGIRMCHLPDSLGSCRRDRKAGWEHRFHDCLHTHRQRCHSLARAFVVSADRKAGRHLFPRFVSHHPRTHGRRACLAILLRHGHPPVGYPPWPNG